MLHPVNFRDVGEVLAILSDANAPLPVGMIFRGGKFDSLTRHEDLGRPAAIINLRRGPDPTHLDGVTTFHAPADNTVENYNTEDKRVQSWLREVLRIVVDPNTPWPLYLHCTSGKDRTGVVVAAILRLLSVGDELIVQEYLLSEDVLEENIRHALHGMNQVIENLVNPMLLAKRIEQAFENG